MTILILIFGLLLNSPNYALSRQGNYNLYLSTMEVVDRDGDHEKDGMEIFYILKKGKENIELNRDNISYVEAYLYEDRKEEVLIYFWRVDNPEDLISDSSIYLPFRQGFAYNIYIDKIVPAFLKIKIVFSDDREIEAQIKDRLSFLAY